MYVRKKELVVVIIVLALALVLPAVILSVFWLDSNDLITGSAIGLGVENETFSLGVEAGNNSENRITIEPSLSADNISWPVEEPLIELPIVNETAPVNESLEPSPSLTVPDQNVTEPAVNATMPEPAENETGTGPNKTALEPAKRFSNYTGNNTRESRNVSLGAEIRILAVPLVNVTSPVNNTRFLNISIPVSFWASDASVSQCWFDIQNGTNNTIASCANFSLNPGRGFFRIQFFANDTTNNINATTAWINFSVNRLPAINSLLLNTTYLTLNGTAENITANVSWTDADNESVKIIYNWFVNDTAGPGRSITILNMPFERVNGTNSSNAWDYSGYGNNGSDKNGVVWNGSGGYDGKGVYHFDGSNDVITTSYNINLQVKDFTLMAWDK